MNRQYLLKWMENPALLSQETLADLSQLIRDYPYFQSARILLTMNLKALNDHRFEAELRRCAAYASCRSRLKSLITAMHDTKPAGKAVSHIDEPAINAKLESSETVQLQNLEEQIRASLQQIEQNKLRLMKLLAEKKAIVGNELISSEEAADSIDKTLMRPLPKDAMLDEYLRLKPDGTREKAAFYSPEEAARKSVEENDGVLSETLARLVAAQGKKEKAIKIYQQLMLKNPQKSSYFAAQIEKLKNQP